MLEPKDEIKQKLDIVEVIGEYLQMKPAGSGSFKAVCPFHAERTPSFHISRERQIWHCFGCDKGGDMFAFVMELEGMTFPEALRHLARRAGVEVPEFKPQPKAVTDARETLLAVQAWAQKFYAKVLHDHPEAAEARGYLEQRGITGELIEKFGLGYAPDRWDALVQFLASRGFTKQQILDSGFALNKKSGEGLLDRFRHRVMIPLSDPVGNVVGFTGRVLASPGKTTTPESPKYMNSPESAVYHKGRVLYGLHLAKTGIRSAQSVIVVEGNLDVVSSHKAGVENIVASSGTALTEDQLRLLARYTKRVVFCLDADAAGFAAAKRAFEVAAKMSTPLDIRCLIIPEGAGKDPDEVVQKNPELWQKLSSESRSITEFFFDRALKAYEAKENAASIDDRKRLIAELLPEVARLRSAEERHLYLLRIADATHVALEVLESSLKSLVSSEKAPALVSQVPVAAKPRAGKASQTAEFIICVAISHPGILAELSERLPVEAIPDEPWGRLYSLAQRLYSHHQIDGATNQSLYSRLRNETHVSAAEDLKLLDAALLTFEERVSTLSPKAMREELERHIHLLLSARHETRRRQLESAIREAELAGDSDRLRALLETYAHVLAEKPQGG